MKPLSQQNHYEILEVGSDATAADIEREFRMAQSTYADDSLAGYSVFGEGEASAIRERVEIAYRVLSDADERAAYDAELAASGAAPPPVPDDEGSAEALVPVSALDDELIPLEARAASETSELEALEEEDGEFDGARLRRSRLRTGIEIEDISGVTKINPTYLRFIEEDRYAELPAPVYVRGFVRAYADCVGLDSTRVAASYMRKFEADTDAAPRGRFLSSR
jgi:flagellar biosynthesis protein FlhG